jgi:hypothetical protein
MIFHTSRTISAALLLCDCAGVLSWWCGLVGALHEPPEEWRAEAFTALPTLLTGINQSYIVHHLVGGSRLGLGRASIAY